MSCTILCEAGAQAVDWTPVARERFAEILSSEVSSLEPHVGRLYHQYAVEPFHLPCLRFCESGVEKAFVVAKSGDRLLYFDDVEEDFGVAILDGDGVMREWGNHGPLVLALRVLDQPDFPANR
jgi:hypothetical protein